MAVSFGYTIISVDDVAATLQFYVDAFGLERRFITPDGDYGELETGSTTLAFVASSLASVNLDEAGGFTPLDPSTPPSAVSITLITDCVEETVAEAIGAGATAYVDAVQKPWDQTVAYVRDPNGLLVEVATPIGS